MRRIMNFFLLKIRTLNDSRGTNAPSHGCNYHYIRSVIIIAPLIILFVPCCKKSGDASERAEKKNATASSFTVKDDLSREVEIKNFPPKRIVSLSPETTEMIYFLGAEDRLVAVSKQCNYPPEALVKPKIGGYSDFSPEAVAAFAPDLIIASFRGSPKGAVELLARSGLAVYAVAVTRLSDMTTAYKRLAAALYAQGSPELAEMSLKIDAAADATLKAAKEFGESADASKGRKTLVTLQSSPLFVVGGENLLDDFFKLLKFENAAKSQKGYPLYSAEKAVSDKPDYVFYISFAGDENKGIEALALSRLPWLKKPLICPLSSDEASRATFRMIKIIDDAKACK